jgi:hypothetical protein
MSAFIYSGEKLDLNCFSRFVANESSLMVPIDQTSTCGLIPNVSHEALDGFIDYVYPNDADLEFKEINKRLLHYYFYLFDGLVLAAKMAVAYFNSKENNNPFELSNLYRVERIHYYDNCYHMNYIPKQYADYLTGLIKR